MLIYAPADLPALLHKLQVTDVLLAIPSIGVTNDAFEIVDFLRALPVHVRTPPGVADLANGRVSLSDIAELDIEDLLGATL